MPPRRRVRFSPVEFVEWTLPKKNRSTMSPWVKRFGLRPVGGNAEREWLRLARELAVANRLIHTEKRGRFTVTTYSKNAK
jgi:hypothetical protein